MHSSIKLPVKELVLNGAVREGTRSWVQASGPLPITSAALWPGSTSRALSRLMCRVWCLEKPRLICQYRKGELPSGFLAFKTDGPCLHSKCFLGSSGWPSGTQDLDFLPEHTAACPFCGLSGQWPALWAAVMVDLLSGWSVPSDSWDILSSFMGRLDESAIRSFNNWSPPVPLGLCTFIHSFCTQPFIRLTGIY